MILWESDIQESVVFKPVEIRGKRGRKKMKKSNTAIYIPNMGADNFEKICNEKGLKFIYVKVPPHGRLIDADELFKEMERKGWYDNADRDIAEDLVLDAPTIIEAEEEEHGRD